MCLDSRNHAFGKKRLRMVLLDEQGKLGIWWRRFAPLAT